MDKHDLRYSDFRRIDLNLLVVFDALMEERHVGKAAARVFIGQPAMSHALARLREALADDVFVRSGNRMEPTALAIELAPKVRAWLEEASDFLFARSQFDLMHIKTTVIIGTLGGIESVILPPLLIALRKFAPGVRLWSKALERDKILTAIDDEEVDIAVGPSELSFKEWHHRELIYSSPFVCIYSPDQLNLPNPVPIEDLAAIDQVLLNWRGDSLSEADKFFEARGLLRSVFLRVSDQWTILQILRQFPAVSLQSPLITSTYKGIPGIAVNQIAADGLSVSASIVWHRRNDRQAAQGFVRTLIKEILTKAGER